MKIRAMYDALSVNPDSENSQKEFIKIFKKKFADVNDLKLLIGEANRIGDKIKTLSQPVNKGETLSFSQLVVITELSRGISIPQNTKMFQFYEMYKIELEKWHKT